MADLKKGSRITGVARDKLAAELKKKYEKGASIRALAELNRTVVRLRAPGALGVRRDAAWSRRRDPREEEVDPLRTAPGTERDGQCA